MSEVSKPALSKKSNISFLNNGRIPVIESDGLPLQFITIEKAQRICTSLNTLNETVKSMVSEIQSYSHSAKYILQSVKNQAEENPIFEKHFNQHQRIMGGTLHSLVAKSISEIEDKLIEIRRKIGIEETTE